MGANFLLDAEQLEGWMLLLLKRKEKHQTCLSFCIGLRNKSAFPTNMHQVNVSVLKPCFGKFTTGVECQSISTSSMLGMVRWCSLHPGRTPHAPPCGQRFTQQSSVEATTTLIKSTGSLFQLFLLPPRMLLIAKHSIIFTFSPNTDCPTKKQNKTMNKTKKKTKYLL